MRKPTSVRAKTLLGRRRKKYLGRPVNKEPNWLRKIMRIHLKKNKIWERMSIM